MIFHQGAEERCGWAGLWGGKKRTTKAQFVEFFGLRAFKAIYDGLRPQRKRCGWAKLTGKKISRG